MIRPTTIKIRVFHFVAVFNWRFSNYIHTGGGGGPSGPSGRGGRGGPSGPSGPSGRGECGREIERS